MNISASHIEHLKSDFNTVMKYYECTPDEATQAKKNLLANLEEISKSYSIIAAGIRGLNANN